jgi:cytochrome c biogenesis protein
MEFSGMSSHSIPQGSTPVSSLVKRNPFWKDIINCFRSVHLAIVLLSLLALGTLIGVIMPQVGMVDIAEIEKQYGSNFKFFNTLGFFNVYSSFWFITLQVLFFFNLLIGSFKWLKPATLAAIQKTTLPPQLILQKPEVHSLPYLAEDSKEALEAKIVGTLNRFRYRTHRDNTGNLYASKGNITRLGPCIAHLGILLCLIAGLYSNFTGFKAVRMAVPGESFSIPESNTFKTNVPPTIWFGSIPKWKIHVTDFHVEFYEDHPETAKQYYSGLQILSPEGKVLKEEKISVNHPLLYDDTSIYQASFAPTGRFLLNVDGKPMTIDTNSEFNQRPISIAPLADGATLIMFPFFAQQDPGVTENYGVFFIRKPGEPFGGQGKMPENIKLTVGSSGILKGKNITYMSPEMSTGLQIKRAPEVPLMYASYLIIAIGAALCFFSQRQLWISLREETPGKYEVLLHPKTNKGRLSFRKELFFLEDALTQMISPTKPIKEVQA